MYHEDTKYEIRITLELRQILLLRNTLEAARGIIMLVHADNSVPMIDSIISSLTAFYTLEYEERHRYDGFRGDTIESFQPDVVIKEIE